MSEEAKALLVLKEKRRKEILKEGEDLWRLKSQAIWLSSGDDNKKFFHAYAKGRKVHNTIWELKDDRGGPTSSFEDLSSMGVIHFKKLFEGQDGTSIVEVIRMAGFFTSFVD